MAVTQHDLQRSQAALEEKDHAMDERVEAYESQVALLNAEIERLNERSETTGGFVSSSSRRGSARAIVHVGGGLVAARVAAEAA